MVFRYWSGRTRQSWKKIFAGLEKPFAFAPDDIPKGKQKRRGLTFPRRFTLCQTIP
jgi:hypothetical protein